jgi:hypothetical protein
MPMRRLRSDTARFMFLLASEWWIARHSTRSAPAALRGMISPALSSRRAGATTVE